MELFPQNCLNRKMAEEIEQHIIETLLAYTVPALKQGSESEEELNRSTWSSIVAETIK